MINEQEGTLLSTMTYKEITLYIILKYYIGH